MNNDVSTVVFNSLSFKQSLIYSKYNIRGKLSSLK